MSLLSMRQRGMLFVLSSPSGAGKTTVARRLLRETGLGLAMSVSYTTRGKRKDEVEGRDYYFVTEDEFQQKTREGFFLEHAEVFGHHYGTPRDAVQTLLASGQDVLFDIDGQGAKQITDTGAGIGEIVTMFLLPPSLDSLQARLDGRDSDAPETIRQRMQAAKKEIAYHRLYRYIVVNDEIEDTVSAVRAIIQTERLKQCRPAAEQIAADMLEHPSG